MNVDLLRSTWQHAGRFGDRFVAWFYGQLFYAHPELRDLFGVDMAGQRRKLADTLDLVVAGADNLESVAPRLRKLGRMHRRYQVTVDMYPAVGEALIVTFARFLGDAWTPQAEATWTQAYDLVAGVMVDAHREADRVEDRASWDVLVLDVARDRVRLTVVVDGDCGFPFDGAAAVDVRLPDRPGWRTIPCGRGRPSLVVPVPARPDRFTLSLLALEPGDHLWLAPTVDPVDQEAHP